MDTIVAIHIALQVLVWGILFPVGMVLGLTRSRWHVPLQSVGYLLTIGGYILGATRKGHEYAPGSQGAVAYFLLAPILLQLALGIYLQLRISLHSVRPYILTLHSLVGKTYPIFAWVQMLVGAATLGGYCKDEDLYQCLAHWSMGSSFIAYGIIMAVIFMAGETWVRRRGRSPDFYDSCVMAAWGMFNTFTQHKAGEPWDIHDMQHTSMGVVWLAGGILGILLSRNNQRTVVPSLILIVTGWSMGEHAQHLILSTKVHAMFGRTLIMAGIARIVEVCYFAPRFNPLPPQEPLRDDASSDHTLADSHVSPNIQQDEDDENATKRAAGNAWRHLPPFLYVVSGILFMSATDAELTYAAGIKMDHVTYILIMFTFAFLLYALTVFLIHLYQTTRRQREETSMLSLSPSHLASLREPTTPGVLELEMTPTTATPPSSWRKWYPSRLADRNGTERRPVHILGEDDEDDDEDRAKETMRLYSNSNSIA